MLSRIDRLQLAVPDAQGAAEGWIRILGAELEAQDKLKGLAAKRHTLRVGNGRVELLEPDGSGAVQEAVAKRSGHLFSAGVSTNDLHGLISHLQDQNLEPFTESEQCFLDPSVTGNFGLRVVISPEEKLDKVGEIDFFYEVTLLVHNADERVRQFASIFGLDGDVFVPISSDNYGYKGSLTLFHPDNLDRFEMITPNVPEKTMGRFFTRFGDSYYMAYAESAAIKTLEDRVREGKYGFTVTPANKSADRMADTLFIHPPALGGMMLGISRPTVAWSWSGTPGKVEPAN